MKLFLTGAFCLLCMLGFSQETPDVLFQKAQDLAKEEKYEKAKDVCKSLVEAYPENSDYQLYLGRLQFWTKEYQLATRLVAPIAEREQASDSPSEEVFKLYIQVLLASEEYEKTLSVTSDAIEKFPSEADYYNIQKANAYFGLKETKKGIASLEEIKKNSTYYESANYSKTRALQRQKNLVTIGHLNTTFSNPSTSPWNISSLEYKRDTEKSAYVARVNYGYLFQNTAFQVEFDAYPKLSKTSYLYLNLGFSDGQSVFPVAKVGAEYFKAFSKYDVSAGGRYFYFEDTEVLMLTGHIGRTFNAYNISYRPFVVNQGGSWFATHVLNLRKNFEAKEGFAQLEFQYGAVPYYFFINDVFQRASTYRVGANFRFRIKDNFFVQPILMYELEEFIPDDFRNRFNVQLLLSKRF